MFTRPWPTVFAVCVLLAASSALAQLPGGDGSPGVSTAMLKLFGTNNAFTARADVQVVDGGKVEQLRTPMAFAALDVRLRVEIDMAQIRGKNLPPAAVAGLKQLGMDRVVSLLRPDKQALFILYPNAQSYVHLPFTKEEIAADKNLKVERTALARETVAGHPCVKNQVVIRSGTNVVLGAGCIPRFRDPFPGLSYWVRITAIHGGTADAFLFVNAASVGPTAAFTWKQTGAKKVQFDASTSTGTGLTYSWNFGDPSPTTTATPLIEHTFPTTGVRPVTLTVTDSAGATHSITQSVTVVGLTVNSTADTPNRDAATQTARGRPSPMPKWLPTHRSRSPANRQSRYRSPGNSCRLDYPTLDQISTADRFA